MFEELKPCPFCGGKMFFQKALWPSDGNVDSIIHDGVSQCGMVGFSIGTTDESVIAAWNTRADTTLRAENELMREALEKWVAYDDLDEADFSQAGPMLLYAEAINATRNALAQVAK